MMRLNKMLARLHCTIMTSLCMSIACPNEFMNNPFTLYNARQAINCSHLQSELKLSSLSLATVDTTNQPFTSEQTGLFAWLEP
jgi:hypothetical protein